MKVIKDNSLQSRGASAPLNLFKADPIASAAVTTNVSQYGGTGVMLEDLESSKLYATQAAESAKEAAASASASESSSNLSEYYAQQAADSAASASGVVDDAKKYAEQAAASAAASSTSASESEASATAANSSATSASTSASAAKVSEASAQTSATLSATSATNSENSAKASAISATSSEDSATISQGYAEKSQEIYEAFAKGAVYRGGWNPMSTPNYPDPLGTNSYWDVYLNSGTTSYEWNNITWYSGDRLIYSIPDSQFFHINAVSGVSSINGYTGSVTLDAAKVSALPLTGSTIRDNKIASLALFSDDEWDPYIDFKREDGTGDKRVSYNRAQDSIEITKSDGTPLFAVTESGATVSGELQEEGVRVYSPNNKPPLDTLSGTASASKEITINNVTDWKPASGSFYVNSTGDGDNSPEGTNFCDYLLWGNRGGSPQYHALYVPHEGERGGKLCFANSNNANSPLEPAALYSEKNKPTPAEIGAYTKGEINNMIYKDNTSTGQGNIRVGDGKWIMASREGAGFLPYKSGIGFGGSNSYIGNPGWWFKEIYGYKFIGSSMTLNEKLSCSDLSIKSNEGGTLKLEGGSGVSNILLDFDGQRSFYIKRVSSNTDLYTWTFLYSGDFISPGDVIAYSDIRIKDDIKTIDNALDKVNQIRGVTYTRKDTEASRRYCGVIAQEIEKVLPEVVTDMVNGDISDFKAVSYGNISALLIEAIKELTNKISILEKRVEDAKL